MNRRQSQAINASFARTMMVSHQFMVSMNAMTMITVNTAVRLPAKGNSGFTTALPPSFSKPGTSLKLICCLMRHILTNMVRMGSTWVMRLRVCTAR